MKILIITNGGIGDQIQFSSVIAGLKKKYPQSNITIFCHKQLQFVYKFDTNVSTITSSIKDEEFDIGICFAIKFDLTEIFNDINVKERIGYTQIIKNKKKNIVASNAKAQELLILASKRGQSNKSLSEWFCSIANVEWIRPYFATKNSKEIYKSDIVLQYGTNIKYKNWPDEYYQELIDQIPVKDTVWVTTHIKYADKVVFDVNKLIGNYEQLHEVANLLSQSKLLISPDTAVAHIALALGIKTVVLSGRYDRGFAFSNKFDNLIHIKKKSMKDISANNVLEILNNENLLS